VHYLALASLLLTFFTGNARAQSVASLTSIASAPWTASVAAGEVLAGTRWSGRILTALGGAALGAGVGYFASQVITGDWDEQPGEDVSRPVWAAVGGSIGFAVGFSFPLPGRHSAPVLPKRTTSERQRIATSELRATGIRTAWDAVRTLRPEWLNPRGVHIIGERPDDGIQVYLDAVHLGGVRFLHDVPAETIREMRFFDAAAATLRWGSGNSHGAILIIVDGGGPG
jgi:hypothetical protein